MRQTCAEKVKYGHKETADRAVTEMAKKGVTGLESYYCRFDCNCWHIGHGNSLTIRNILRIIHLLKIRIGELNA